MPDQAVAKSTLSRQLAEQVCTAIVNGQFGIGERLSAGGDFVVQPGYRELAARFTNPAHGTALRPVPFEFCVGAFGPWIFL